MSATRVINFTKLKIPMLILSLVLIAGGIGGTILNKGFNLGIDFMSGLSLRLQIADEIMKLTYTGEGRAVLDIREGVLSVTVITDGGLSRVKQDFTLSDYSTVAELADAVSAVEGVGVIPSDTGSMALSASSIIGLNYSTDLTPEGIPINSSNTDTENYIDISSVRETLEPLGNLQIQVVGRSENQEFIIRMQDHGGERDFSQTASSSIVKLLGARYGDTSIVVKQTDYVGPRFSQLLGYQAVYLTCFALLLILAYIWFRFRLAYAVSAIAALLHDVLFMIGVIGTFQLEVNTATIAAVLTIIGYSLNDTIVIFDRIRENVDLLRDKDFSRVINISITQSLSRTLITSLTTLIAVTAIFVFGTGVIRLFALNLMIGVLVGTYSSIFVASPVLQTWINIIRKRRSEKIGKKYAESKHDDEPPVNDTPESLPNGATEEKTTGTIGELKRIDRKNVSGANRKQRKRVTPKK